MIISDNKKTVHLFIEKINKGKTDSLNEICSLDLKYILDSTLPTGDGLVLSIISPESNLDRFKKALKIIRLAVPDQRIYIENMIGEGEEVWMTGIYEGTPKGDLYWLDINATGVNISYNTIMRFKFRDNKISIIHVFNDHLKVYMQLGQAVFN